MERDTWREDESPISTVYWHACADCGWECEYGDTDPAELSTAACPECGSEDLTIENDGE